MEIKNNVWNIKDKYVMITGATSGIGLAAIKELAHKVKGLGLIARNEIKARIVADDIREATNGKMHVDVFIGNMSSQETIRELAHQILLKCTKIDVLINNAGALFENHQITDEGIEMTWALNHLGPYLLTMLLLERLNECDSARIITTSSHGHKMAKRGIDFNDLNAERKYRPFRKMMGEATLRYAETKLANILFTAELGRKLKDTGVRTYCYDPGLVATNFNRNNGRLAHMTMDVMKIFSLSPEKGAETLLWLIESSQITNQTGCYYANKRIQVPSVQAQDKIAAEQLWRISEEQTKVTFPL
ncbi:SDR family NAD(P)-dependent oxidoreductase [Fictibacillus sp. 5RED26]|uniref:SDR family NAD(P)-dependent oxidoreductase n=1 Tax=Fictibacillus sp. 5RED26 TaxID=2745876 RepID=UPI0018CF52E3|nr:SDR family NAD(P)-dependent oxidoreductase [Fictibacillus sp. 5RED26]MBH0157344.1 SDR family NAD(P)-dependent oxidoreductase [Fictibacillus sp. 5RED26]